MGRVREINRGRGKGIIGFELDYKRSHKKVDRLQGEYK